MSEQGITLKTGHIISLIALLIGLAGSSATFWVKQSQKVDRVEVTALLDKQLKSHLLHPHPQTAGMIKGSAIDKGRFAKLEAQLVAVQAQQTRILSKLDLLLDPSHTSPYPRRKRRRRGR